MKLQIFKLISAVICAALIISFVPTHIIAQTDVIELKYDDRYTFTGYTVKSVGDGVPASYKVGYGIEKNTVKDDEVLTVKEGDSSTVIATGIGSTVVTLEKDGQTIEKKITVVPAKLTVLIVLGQSNAEGDDGNIAQSIACDDGMVYSSYAPHAAHYGARIANITDGSYLNTSNGSHFACASLTDNSINQNGDQLPYAVNALTESGNGKGGMDSGLAYEWVKQTGEKVWIINAAACGSSISMWNTGTGDGDEYREAIGFINKCMETLGKEIMANHYTFSHMSYVWLQGESDRLIGEQDYAEKMLELHCALKDAVRYDFDSDGVYEAALEYGVIVLVRAFVHPYYDYNDIAMNGPRKAQLYLSQFNVKGAENLILGSAANDYWVEMSRPTSNNSTVKWFKNQYPDGCIDYPTQSEAIAFPTCAEDVKNSIHFKQIGYNENGLDTVRNLVHVYGYNTESEQADIKLFNEAGRKEYQDSITAKAGDKIVIVPKVEPYYKSSDGIDMIVDEGVGEFNMFTLTVQGEGNITYKLSDGTEKVISIKLNNSATTAPTSDTSATTAATNLTPNSTTVITSTGTDDGKIGDLNRDSSVNIIDLLIMKRILGAPDSEYALGYQTVADLNKNNSINISDLLIMKKLVATA